MCVSTTHWFSASHGTLVDIVKVILQFCLGEVNQFSMECVFLNFKSNLCLCNLRMAYSVYHSTLCLHANSG